MEEPGQKLKKIRERLRLRFRDVEEASARIGALHANDEKRFMWAGQALLA